MASTWDGQEAWDDRDDAAQASILIVDDKPANLMALEAVLEPLGHRVVKASSGEEALRCLLTQDFALILMDVAMPELDGFQTVALIKRRPATANVPIMFVTAIAREAENIARGYRYGAVDYITKPFDPDILRAKVSVLVALQLQADRIAQQREQLRQRRHDLERQQLDLDAAITANEMKDRFLAMISHELRGPLNQIVGWSDLLLHGNPNQAMTREALLSIESSAALQCRLVDDLVDASRIALQQLRIERTRVELPSLVHSVVDSYRLEARRRGLTLTTTVESDGDIVADGDPVRLSQALRNLVGNALHFTPSGGVIELRLLRRAGLAVIEVRDSGIGIDAADLPRVFERFWRADRGATHPQQGLGLGLAIARELVRLHGGTLDAHSDGLGRGATFTVTLPLAPVVAALTHDASPQS